ncbi:hypothetical protein BDZ89DRAFT_1056845 [Hymenopellis radicata]|nr:hypothetical protein BDZ89DRAFT_1056845 [Hymenopellis radicata]
MTDPANRSVRGKDISRPMPLRHGSHHKGSSNGQKASQPAPSEGRTRKDSMAAKALKSLHLKK